MLIRFIPFLDTVFVQHVLPVRLDFLLLRCLFGDSGVSVDTFNDNFVVYTLPLVGVVEVVDIGPLGVPPRVVLVVVVKVVDMGSPGVVQFFHCVLVTFKKFCLKMLQSLKGARMCSKLSIECSMSLVVAIEDIIDMLALRVEKPKAITYRRSYLTL